MVFSASMAKSPKAALSRRHKRSQLVGCIGYVNTDKAVIFAVAESPRIEGFVFREIGSVPCVPRPYFLKSGGLISLNCIRTGPYFAHKNGHSSAP